MISTTIQSLLPHNLINEQVGTCHMANDEQLLQTSISNKIMSLCKLGYQIFDDGDPKTALRHFYNAWTLLPKPQTQWQEAGWVLTALGDVYFEKGDYKHGREALLSALHCPNTIGNPVVHLRLGQCQWELGNHSEALSQFKQVIINGGRTLFQQENKKYFDSIKNATFY